MDLSRGLGDVYKRQGVYIAPALYEAGFVSGAHTAQDIADTVSAAREIFKTL
jgi:glutamate-1-semialdehyde 2,1-aminomutase